MRAPVTLATDAARVLIARKDFPATTLQDFVAYAKQNQATMQYGSAGAGSGSHVCTVLLDDRRWPVADNGEGGVSPPLLVRGTGSPRDDQDCVGSDTFSRAPRMSA